MQSIVRQFIAYLAPSLLLLSLVALGQPAYAAEAGNGITQPATLDTGSFIQMFLALGLVIVIILGLSFAVRKFNMFTTGSSRHIRIVGGMALSNKDRLLIVQVGEEQILLSASPGRISKVHELSTPIADDTVLTSKPGNNSFANLLQAVTQRGRS